MCRTLLLLLLSAFTCHSMENSFTQPSPTYLQAAWGMGQSLLCLPGRALKGTSKALLWGAMSLATLTGLPTATAAHTELAVPTPYQLTAASPMASYQGLTLTTLELQILSEEVEAWQQQVSQLQTEALVLDQAIDQLDTNYENAALEAAAVSAIVSLNTLLCGVCSLGLCRTCCCKRTPTHLAPDPTHTHRV